MIPFMWGRPQPSPLAEPICRKKKLGRARRLFSPSPPSYSSAQLSITARLNTRQPSASRYESPHHQTSARAPKPATPSSIPATSTTPGTTPGATPERRPRTQPFYRLPSLTHLRRRARAAMTPLRTLRIYRANLYQTRGFGYARRRQNSSTGQDWFRPMLVRPSPWWSREARLRPCTPQPQRLTPLLPA